MSSSFNRFIFSDLFPLTYKFQMNYFRFFSRKIKKWNPFLSFFAYSLTLLKIKLNDIEYRILII